MAKKKKTKRRYNAHEIISLLLEKHWDDVAVPECKIGPTWSAGTQKTRRFDMWVMKKSWVNPNFIGYEVKVARSDFIGDQKWREYLPFCSEFFFVAPPGIIDKKEVPEDAGLMVCSVNASRLYTKKKAPYREIDPPAVLFMYILMSRIKVVREMYETNNVEKWRAWLREKDEKKELGWNVSKKIQELVDKRIKTAEKEVSRARRDIERFEVVKKWMEKNGVDHTSKWSLESKLTQLLDEYKQGYTRQALRTLQNAEHEISNVIKVLQAEKEK